MNTNIVAFIFLLVFLKNVASHPKLYVVDLVKKGSNDRKLKINKAFELIKDGNHQKLHRDPIRDLDKTYTGVSNEEYDYDESGVEYDEQDTSKVDNCLSLRPRDIRECLKYKIDELKSQSHKTEMERGTDKLKKIKTPDGCMALDALEQLQCLEKFNNQPKYYESNDEVNYDDLENLKEPTDCLLLKRTTLPMKLKCLEMIEKRKDPEVIIKYYDNFEYIKDPNECLFLEKATAENKLKCMEKFEKKNMVLNDVIENIKNPTDCLSLKTSIKIKYKCLDKFGNTNIDDYEVIQDDFDNLKEPNDCLFLKETLQIKIKCLDKFQKLEEKATQNAKKMIIPTVDVTLRTEDAKVITTPEDCLFVKTSYGKKLKCSVEIAEHKENIRSRSVESYHQFISPRSNRKKYSFYNYYNARMNPSAFKDLTRQQFSQDYLDISELSRSLPTCRSSECNVDVLKVSYKIKENPDLINNSRRIFDRVHARHIQADSNDDSDEFDSPKPTKRKVQKKKNGVPIRFIVVSKEETSEEKYDSESGEHRSLKTEADDNYFEDKQDSEEENPALIKKQSPKKIRKAPSEEIDQKSDSEEEPQAYKKKKKSPKQKQKSPAEETDQKSFFESEENLNKGIAENKSQKSFEKKRKKKAKKPRDDDYSIETERPSSLKYSYLQGNNVVDFIRRRLEHFMPKRYHWDQDNFRNLGYNWYDGPRGKWTE